MVLCAKLLYAQGYTPNGKPLSSINLGIVYNSMYTQEEIDYMNNWIKTNYPDVEILQSWEYNLLFNCHFFTWLNIQGYEVWDEDYVWKNGMPSRLGWSIDPDDQFLLTGTKDFVLGWLFSLDDFYSDAEYSIPQGYPSYVTTSASDAAICVYRDNGEIMHSARMLENSNKVISKWGAMGVYKHYPLDCPSSYGCITEYYKINPDYRPVNDPGNRFLAIDEALQGTPVGSIVSVYPGTYTVGSLTVAEGTTLYIQNGATLRFATGSKLKVYGSINAFGVTFTSNAEPGGLCDWNGIVLYENGKIENCIIENARQGIKTTNCNSVTLRRNILRNCDSGILCINGGTPIISGNSFSDIKNNAIFSYSTPSIIDSNQISSSNANTGILISSNPSPFTISENHISDVGYGIYLSNASYSVLENNSIENSRIDSVKADVESIVDGQIEGTEEGIIHSHYLGVSFKTAENNTINTEPEQIYEQGLSYIKLKNYNDALVTFKDLIINYSDSKCARQALRHISIILETKKENRLDNIIYFKDIMQSFINNDINNKIVDIIDRQILYWLKRNKLYDEAEKKYDELIAKSLNEDEADELIFGKAIFYIYELNRPEKAVTYLNMLLGSDNIFSDFSKDELDDLGITVTHVDNITKNDDYEADYRSVNYPNPFNGVTTINFATKKPGPVKITVYNLIGQEIAVLINQELPVGIHQVQWSVLNQSGVPVSTGVYFYRIVRDGAAETRKMLYAR